jgi:hypothetical protein
MKIPEGETATSLRLHCSPADRLIFQIDRRLSTRDGGSRLYLEERAERMVQAVRYQYQLVWELNQLGTELYDRLGEKGFETWLNYQNLCQRLNEEVFDYWGALALFYGRAFLDERFSRREEKRILKCGSTPAEIMLTFFTQIMKESGYDDKIYLQRLFDSWHYKDSHVLEPVPEILKPWLLPSGDGEVWYGNPGLVLRGKEYVGQSVPVFKDIFEPGVTGTSFSQCSQWCS